jgi:hypothetical protein
VLLPHNHPFRAFSPTPIFFAIVAEIHVVFQLSNQIRRLLARHPLYLREIRLAADDDSDKPDRFFRVIKFLLDETLATSLGLSVGVTSLPGRRRARYGYEV